MQDQSTREGNTSIEEYISSMNKAIEEYKKQQAITLEKLNKLEQILNEQTEYFRNLQKHE